MSLLIITIPHSLVSIIVHKPECTKTMLLVLKPLAFIFLAIRKGINTLSLTLTFDIFSFKDITILEDGTALALWLSCLHLSLVLSTIMSNARAKSDFLRK